MFGSLEDIVHHKELMGRHDRISLNRWRLGHWSWRAGERWRSTLCAVAHAGQTDTAAGEIGMKAFLAVAVVLTASFVQVSPVLAANRTIWVGRDTGDKNVVWTLSKISGDSWVLKENGKKFADCDATQIKNDFIELDMSGGGKIRINNGKLQMTKPGSKTEWIDVANGKWTD
jgi:hypothetical protein